MSGEADGASVDALDPEPAALEHGLHRDPAGQMPGADREEDGAGAVEAAGQPVGEAAVAAGDEAFVELGRERLHFRGDAMWSGKVAVPASAQKYVRAETYSRDGRRAYSNAIYLP